MLVKYLISALGTMQQRREREMLATAKYSSSSSITRRFEQIVSDCQFVVSNLMPVRILMQSLQNTLVLHLNVEQLTAELSVPQQPKEQKMVCWEKIKVDCFTRIVAAVYLSTLLLLLTTAQLCLLGRYFYIDSVAALTKNSATIQISEDSERRYLTFSWHLLHDGSEKCVEHISKAVQKVVAP